ncbi:hypothetical protein SAMN04487977_105124 [Treponema bryantii]|uniref:HTH luxR-type domain-containing protein n=1 Tax=Treponema bryantii TaxID=163 RepID=A0A1H9GSI4_9SPIR|nr:response regulator transcription factor [Treponema bryantii]SEQ53076.1 hypothetical protein SAMN04487977_105124 [Treponema bryantii]
MKQRSVYSKEVLLVVRYISLATLILLSYTTIKKLYICINSNFYASFDFQEKITEIFGFINNIIVIIFAGILIKHPQRFFLIGIGSLSYSIPLSIINSEPYMSLLMLFVAFSTGFLRLNTNKQKLQYVVLFILIYIFEFFFPLTQGFDCFREYALVKIAITLLLFIIIFFFFEFAKQQGVKEGVKDKVLNLAKYKGLDRSDMYLLQQILDNKKYKEIAQKLHGSEGALRNKLSKIYKILEVGDRTGFLSIYSGYELIYEPELIDTPTN